MPELYKTEEWKLNLREHISKVISGGGSSYDHEEIGKTYLLEAPASIFKYFPDDKYRLEAIETNKMWYSSPIGFNDVFDTEFYIDGEAVFNNILKKAKSNYEHNIRPGSKVWKELRNSVSKGIQDVRNVFGKIRITTGVTCFSEVSDSLLMWSHYAKNHQGVCIEYELSKFNSELQFTPVPMIYSLKKPCLDNFDIDDPERDILDYFIKCLTTKYSEWSYEREWRIIREKNAHLREWDNDNNGALLPSVKPESIILGCNSNPEFEADVTRYCNNSQINLFKMEKDQTEYKLMKKSVLVFTE